jgi:adenylate cyclase
MLGAMEHLSEEEAARRAGTTPATLQAWVRDGLLPRYDGTWTPELAAQARLVARLQERGHSRDEIREAERRGALAFGGIEHLLGATGSEIPLEDAADQAGIDPEFAAEAITAMGFRAANREARLGPEDVDVLRAIATAVEAGLPRVALLQLLRVYGHALAQVADAEVRLFHLYVHEPLMQDGVPGEQIARELEDLVRGLLPLASPIMRRVHDRHLRRFVAQDVIGHMEDTEASGDGAGARARIPGRLRVAIAFADLAGYTRMTEELGDEEAVLAIERFIEEVEGSLPASARVVKEIGDEVMLVGSDVVALTAWAVTFQAGRVGRRPQPRIGLHVGDVLYRDGEYYGREVNLAARVAARAAGGEVLITRAVDEAVGDGLARERIGEVRLKGFNEATELFLAYPRR